MKLSQIIQFFSINKDFLECSQVLIEDIYLVKDDKNIDYVVVKPSINKKNNIRSSEFINILNTYFKNHGDIDIATEYKGSFQKIQRVYFDEFFDIVFI